MGIFDIDTTASSKVTKGMLQEAQREGRVIDICEDMPRSFVMVVEDFGNVTLYVTGRSSRSLKKRYDLQGEEEWKKT